MLTPTGNIHMKKLVLFLFFLGAFGLQAQTKRVMLEINHRIGSDTCASSVQGVNNLGNIFKLNRIQYYIDEIILTQGMQAPDTSSTIALVDGFSTTMIDLGEFVVDSLESIRFAIGVNEDLNHLDPTTYNPQHPLAPKSPSMHWGWTAGYRFICAEGLGGSNLSQIFEFHGLGDDNYAHLTIPTQGTMLGTDTLLISINADYNELFRGQTLATGPISHGETGAAAQVIHNMNNYVFTSSEGNAAMATKENSIPLTVFPNPSNGFFRVVVDAPSEFKVIDILGRTVESGRLDRGENTLELSSKGLYLLQVQHKTGAETIKLHVR